MVNVDGREIRVRTVGLGARTNHQPVVVFERGGAAPLETWDAVLSAVGTFAPLVAYDRVGTGQSPWDSLPQTPERIVGRLRPFGPGTEPAPYVALHLTGESWIASPSAPSGRPPGNKAGGATGEANGRAECKPGSRGFR